ncbi:MAG: hypothetical protein GQ542_19560 [Desulforhopalus sp.]|nr:hypothetical protein [Desulforhopalus sp.]
MLINRIIAAILLSFTVFTPVLGHGKVHDGNDLLQKCNNVIKIYEDGIEESEITESMLADASFCNGGMARFVRHGTC